MGKHLTCRSFPDVADTVLNYGKEIAGAATVVLMSAANQYWFFRVWSGSRLARRARYSARDASARALGVVQARGSGRTLRGDAESDSARHFSLLRIPQRPDSAPGAFKSDPNNFSSEHRRPGESASKYPRKSRMNPNNKVLWTLSEGVAHPYVTRSLETGTAFENDLRREVTTLLGLLGTAKLTFASVPTFGVEVKRDRVRQIEK